MIGDIQKSDKYNLKTIQTTWTSGHRTNCPPFQRTRKGYFIKTSTISVHHWCGAYCDLKGLQLLDLIALLHQ